MRIEKIILRNYRIYHGENELDLSVKGARNVCIVSGNNGFGKTSLLTSLVWCLYGKLMSDVDDRYRKEINESGGYHKYAVKCLNRMVGSGMKDEKNQLLLDFEAAKPKAKDDLKSKLEELNSYSVTLVISQLFIPTIPCKELRIKRTYNAEKQKETIPDFFEKGDHIIYPLS